MVRDAPYSQSSMSRLCQSKKNPKDCESGNVGNEGGVGCCVVT